MNYVIIYLLLAMMSRDIMKEIVLYDFRRKGQKPVWKVEDTMLCTLFCLLWPVALPAVYLSIKYGP